MVGGCVIHPGFCAGSEGRSEDGSVHRRGRWLALAEIEEFERLRQEICETRRALVPSARAMSAAGDPHPTHSDLKREESDWLDMDPVFVRTMGFGD